MGFALPGWIRGYMSYVLPLIIILVYLKGYYDMFSPKGLAVLAVWMIVSLLVLAFVGWKLMNRGGGADGGETL